MLTDVYDAQGLDCDHLVIEHIQVNRAPKMRRRTYRAHGRINGEMAYKCFSLHPGQSRATVGHGKTLSRSPISLITTSFCMCRDRDAEDVEREETWGGVFPHHPTRGSGEHHKLHQRSLGQSPSRKWILRIFEVRKKPSGTPFSVFLSKGRAPKVAGPWKTFFSSRRACLHHVLMYGIMECKTAS